jgi:hypothetical protein
LNSERQLQILRYAQDDNLQGWDYRALGRNDGAMPVSRWVVGYSEVVPAYEFRKATADPSARSHSANLLRMTAGGIGTRRTKTSGKIPPKVAKKEVRAASGSLQLLKSGIEKKDRVKMSPFKVRCALIALFLLAPLAAFAQDKKGTVKVDSLAVYSNMSADSDVVKTLARGTVVRILIRVSGGDGDWCSIASEDESSRMGYVPCTGLDRPKEIPAPQSGRAPKMVIMQWSTPIETTAKKQTRGIEEEEGQAGQALAPLPGYSWNSNQKTLVIAIREGCPYCDASMPFYRQLGEQERSARLRAHVLVVMPDGAASGSRFLSKENVGIQAVFGQRLGALKVLGTPTVLLLDSSGHIEREWIGELTPSGEKDVMAAAAE